MTVAPRRREGRPLTVGGRTLEIFAETPRLNAWIFSKLRPHVHGDVLEIGSGIGTLSHLIVARAATAVLSDAEPRYLDALRTTFAGDARVTVAGARAGDCPALVRRHRGDQCRRAHPG